MGQNLIVAKNIKTGETLEFASQKEVADYLTDVYGKKNIHKQCGCDYKTRRAIQKDMGN